jgi:hypothetical protein
MEGNLLIDLPDVYEEGGGEEDIAFPIGGLINIMDSNRHREAFPREVMFLDKGPVDA